MLTFLTQPQSKWPLHLIDLIQLQNCISLVIIMNIALKFSVVVDEGHPLHKPLTK